MALQGQPPILCMLLPWYWDIAVAPAESQLLMFMLLTEKLCYTAAVHALLSALACF